MKLSNYFGKILFGVLLNGNEWNFFHEITLMSVVVDKYSTISLVLITMSCPLCNGQTAIISTNHGGYILIDYYICQYDNCGKLWNVLSSLLIFVIHNGFSRSSIYPLKFSNEGVHSILANKLN